MECNFNRWRGSIFNLLMQSVLFVCTPSTLPFQNPPSRTITHARLSSETKDFFEIFRESRITTINKKYFHLVDAGSCDTHPDAIGVDDLRSTPVFRVALEKTLPTSSMRCFWFANEFLR